MGDDESWSRWFMDSLVTNGVVLGVAFLSFSIWRNFSQEQQKVITAVKLGSKKVYRSEKVNSEAFLEVFEAHVEKLRSFLTYNSGVVCIVGNRGSGRSAVAMEALKSWNGSHLIVNLLGNPSETVGSWISKLDVEGHQSTMQWNVLKSAVSQLYGLLRGGDLELDGVNNLKGVDSDVEDRETMVKFRETLRLIETDLMKRYVHGEILLVLDGLESFGSLIVTDVGRRAVSIFLEFVQRLAANKVAVVWLVVDDATFLELFVWNAQVRDVALVHIDGLSMDSLKKLYPNCPEQLEGCTIAELNAYIDSSPLEFSQWDQIRQSAQRYAVAIRSPQFASRFAPLRENNDEEWDGEKLKLFLHQMTKDNTESELEVAIDALGGASNLLAILKNKLLSYNPKSGRVCLPRKADYYGLQALKLSSSK